MTPAAAHEEREALQRVARAVADDASPERVFATVAHEVAGLLGVEAGIVWRFDDFAALAVGSWGDHGTSLGSRFPLRGGGAITRVWASGRAARTRYDSLPPDDPTRARVIEQGYRSGVAAPVRARGRIWGAVLAATTAEAELPPDAEERLGRFAEFVAAALALSEEQRAEGERVAEGSALRRIATAVAAGTPPAGILALVSREAAQLVGASAGGVLELVGDGHAAVRAAWSVGDRPTPPLNSVAPLERSVVEDLRAGRPARTGPPSDPADATPWREEFEDVVSTPILIGGRPWGLLSVGAHRGTDIPPGAERRLQRFAEVASTAVANAHAQGALRDRAAEQASLRRVATAVAADSDRDEIFLLACREAAALLEAASALVVRLEDERMLRVVGTWQEPGLAPPPVEIRVRMSDSPQARAVRAGLPVRVPADVLHGDWKRAIGESVIAPISVRGRVWGLVLVSPLAGETLPGSAEERLVQFSELLGAAITNAENRQTIVDAADEQAALRGVATAIAADAEPDEVFNLVCRSAAQLLSVPSAAVMRLLGDDRLQSVASWTVAGHPAPRPGAEDRLAPPDGALRAIPRGAAIRVTPGDGSFGWARPYRDVVGVPIVLDHETWGLLLVASAEGPVTGPMETRLAHFADLAGVAIASAEVRRRSVDDAASMIADGGLDMDATLRAIVASARRALNADRATCRVLGEDGRGEAAIHSTEEAPEVLEAIRAAAGSDAVVNRMLRILASPDPVVECEDVSQVPGECDLGVTVGVGAYLAVRLEHPSVAADPRGPVLGVMFVSFRTPRRFTARDRMAVRSVASIAGLALANARLHGRTLEHLAQAERQAATDPLTGLANHREFHARLHREVVAARAAGRPLALALFDLDRFAEVNARHGHEVGDRVLAQIAAGMAGHAGPGALLARTGGEEFAWLLPGDDSLAAWQVADRAREAVRQLTLAHGERMTLSAGVADLTHAGEPSELLRLAEGALYWAKAHGRDITFRYSPEVVEELSAEERVMRLERSQALSAIRVLARAVDAKDPSTRQHSERVADLADLIADELGWRAEQRALLREAGLVHDVGKIGVPDSILFTPKRLTPGEYEQVKEHARLGAQIVADVLSPDQVGWVRWHHERVDGSGYPDRLAGPDIPLGALVLGVADAWDVMTSARPYSAPISPAAAREELRSGTGSQFDAEVVAALERALARGIPVPG